MVERLTLLVALLACGAVGCGEACSCAGDSIAKAAELKDKMCACKDAACADGVDRELAKQIVAGHDREPPKPTEEEAKKVLQLATERTRCAARARGTRTP